MLSSPSGPTPGEPENSATAEPSAQWPTDPTPPPAGSLSPVWRAVLGLAWFGVVLGYAAVSRSSRELGLPTWWLGPASSPQPYPVMALPFAVAGLVIALTSTRMRWLPHVAVAAAVVLWAIALGDLLGDYPRLGIVQGILATAGGAVAAASFTGRIVAIAAPADTSNAPARAASPPATDEAADISDAETVHDTDTAAGR